MFVRVPIHSPAGLHWAAMRESQRNDPFETPERGTIRGSTRDHVASLEQSNDDATWILSGMRHLLLVTTGWRSGAVRKAALPFWLDEDDHPIVVGSYAGAARASRACSRGAQQGTRETISPDILPRPVVAVSAGAG